MGCQISTPQCSLFMQSFQHLDIIQFEGFDRQAKVTPEAVQLVKQSWAKMLQPKPTVQPLISHSSYSGTPSPSHPNSVSDTNTAQSQLSTKRSNGLKTMSSHTLFFEHFYGRLDPATAAIFAGSKSIKSRADSLIRMISSAVTLATQPAHESEESFKRCAAAHAVRGINASQFAPVVDALIYSLAQMLGDNFPREAWLIVFSNAVIRMAPGMAKIPKTETQSDSQPQCPYSKKLTSPLSRASISPLPVASPVIMSPQSKTLDETQQQSNDDSDIRHPHQPESSASSFRTVDNCS